MKSRPVHFPVSRAMRDVACGFAESKDMFISRASAGGTIACNDNDPASGRLFRALWLGSAAETRRSGGIKVQSLRR